MSQNTTNNASQQANGAAHVATAAIPQHAQPEQAAQSAQPQQDASSQDHHQHNQHQNQHQQHQHQHRKPHHSSKQFNAQQQQFYSPQQQYYAQQMYAPNQYYPQAPYYVPSPYQQKVSFRTPDGTPVSFAPQSPVQQKPVIATGGVSVSASPLLASATIHPKSADPHNPAKKIDETKKLSAIEEFKLKIAAKKQAAEAAKKGAQAEAPKAESQPKPEVKQEEVKQEAKPEAAPEVKPKQEETKPETKPVEEAKPEITPVPAPVSEPTPVSTPLPVTTSATESHSVDTIPEVPEGAEAAKEDQEEPKEEPKEDTKEELKEEDEEVDDGSLTVSKFLEKISAVQDIKDPFTFKYPEGFNAPDSKLADAPFRKYDPPFLIQFCSKTKFKVDNDFKERIKVIQVSDKRANDRGSSSKGGLLGSNFRSMNNFSKSSSNRNKNFESRTNSRANSKRGGNKNSKDRKSNRNRHSDKERDDRTEVPSEPVKPLEKSATRWIPKSRAAKVEEVKYAPDGKTVILSNDDIKRKTNSLLNKLTLEHFDSISDEIISYANQSQWEENAESLKYVLELIFAKACDEPHWSSMYAQLCVKLMKQTNADVKDVSASHGKTGPDLAYICLVARCQTEYEKWSAADKPEVKSEEKPTESSEAKESSEEKPEEKSEEKAEEKAEEKSEDKEKTDSKEPEMLSDEYYIQAAAKRRGLGLVKFIGHLYTLSILKPTIIATCLTKLTENQVDPAEETLESLIQLLTTTAPNIETSEKGYQFISTIFDKIDNIIKNAKISSRLKFKLMDLVDLRKAKWRGGEGDGPKTIAQIHEEQEIANRNAELERLSNNSGKRNNSNRGGMDSRSNSSRSAWGSGKMESKSRQSQTNLSDFGRNKSTRSQRNLSQSQNQSQSQSQSQQQGQLNATPSASTPTTPSTPATEAKKEAPANMFAALNHEEHSEEEEEEVEETEEATEEVAEAAEATEEATEDAQDANQE